jgi:predicted dehydrogenase
METSRRNFIRTAAVGTAGLMLGGAQLSAKSYKRVIGANDRIHVGVMGLGRRVGGFIPPLTRKASNVELLYLCDVMKHKLDEVGKQFRDKGTSPELINDFRKMLDDKKVDAIVNATPDHWHAPGSIYALQAGKHVYVEKPCSHNMNENELLVAASKKYDRHVQMGNQQRSSGHTIAIINDIHNGIIGTPYRAVAFYNNGRGEVPRQKAAAVPVGLDWDLFQGPAPRRAYTSETWNYNWHWYGWDFGTAELGNNATHELDVARWALQVNFPNRVDINASKSAFVNDGWEMYDQMEASSKFDNDKLIIWDGKSRNAYQTYGAGRGTIIYGSEGTVFVDRGRYEVFDRKGNSVKKSGSISNEGGLALGGGGDMTTTHMLNFLESIRGKVSLQAPIDDASISMAMVHYGNAAYRAGTGFDIDPKTGKMLDPKAMEFWSRTYAKGWELKL